MKLNLTKPIVFFDLETTGLKITTDRIVEIAFLKIFPNGDKEKKNWLVNPTIPIPEEVSNIHGITDEKVKNEPTFKELVNDIFNFIKGCDLGGYNSNKFDIPLLAEEFIRADFDFNINNIKTIDIQLSNQQQIALQKQIRMLYRMEYFNTTVLTQAVLLN